LNGNGLSDSSDLLAANMFYDVQSTGLVVTGENIAAASATGLVALSASAFQINGSLTSTGAAGAVITAIAAAGLDAVTSEAYFYVALDNGIDTGIYRVLSGTVTGTLGASEIASATLVGIAAGVSDVGTLTSANFITS